MSNLSDFIQSAVPVEAAVATIQTELSAATPNATASTLAFRDGSGNMSAATPSSGGQVATKNYVDTAASGGTQAANTAWRGPTSGSAATPTWRADTLADLPSNVLIFGGTAGSVSLRPVVQVPATPVITNHGTAGAATWSYVMVAVDAIGTSISAASTVGTTTAGNATLTSSNYNIITGTATQGAASYNFYRTVAGTSPTTLGKIGSSTTPVFNDTGLAGDATSAPTTTTLVGEFWQNGSYATDSPTTYTRFRMHCTGSFSINHTSTIATELAGGVANSLSCAGGPGQGLGGGQGGCSAAGSSYSGGGGGGGNGGAGGAGGRYGPGYGFGAGGAAYAIENQLTGSGGGAGSSESTGGSTGGPGGGALYVEAGLNISINANLTGKGANGSNSAGAGDFDNAAGGGSGATLAGVCGGNFLINTGVTVNLNGGNGGSAAATRYSGGGGGGGAGKCVIRAASTVSNLGTITQSGGSGGASGSSVSTGPVAAAGASFVPDIVGDIGYSVRTAP